MKGRYQMEQIEKLSERIRKIINPTLNETYIRYIQNFRKNHVPKEYNQIKLLDDLTNPEIDFLIDLSNRTDGKTFNYFHAFIDISIEFSTGIMFLVRKPRERQDIQITLEAVIGESNIYELSDFTFIRTERYIEIIYKSKHSIAVITDLNSATQTKRISNFIKQYPILVYDEFIALDGDYLPDEWNKLKTIYNSVDRNKKAIPLIQFPKIFLFGNPENFNSPLLSGLNLFSYMENHPINTQQQYKNIILGMYRNEQANKKRNTRAFQEDDDAMTTGEFKVNNYMIATDEDKSSIRLNQSIFYIKLSNDFLQIKYNRDTFKCILAIVHSADNYQFNLVLKDNKDDSIYLKETYFDERQIRKINRGRYLYENMFSKDYIITDFNGLQYLKIDKLIRQYDITLEKVNPVDIKEKQYKDTYIEDTKKALAMKFFGG